MKIVGVTSFPNQRGHFSQKPYDEHPNRRQGRPWSDELFPRIRGGPFRNPQIYEDVGPALFPQADPFPPGGPSVLAPPGKGLQNFKVGSSLNFGSDQSNKIGNFGSLGGGAGLQNSFTTSSNQFGNGAFAGGQNSNQFGFGGGGFDTSFPLGTQGGFQGSVIDEGRPFLAQDGGLFAGLGTSQNFGIINGATNIPGQQFNPFQTPELNGFGQGFPGKFESTLAKNPLFLVLKLLITEPGLWVTSPVLYHGLAHTGIVKPYPQGFGIYGFRFPNNIPDSQAYGNSNILQDKQ